MATKETMESKYRRQEQLEEESMELGINRYRQRLLPWQAVKTPQAESNMPVGRRLLSHSVEPVAKRIEAFIEANTKPGRGGARRNAALIRFMSEAEPEEMAFAALRTVVNDLTKTTTLSRTARHVSLLIETQVQYREVMAQNDGLSRYLDKKVEHVSDERHRRKIVQDAYRKMGAGPSYLAENQRQQLGTMLLGWVAEETGMIELKRERSSGDKENTLVVPTEDALEWLENAHEHAEKLFPVKLPMVVPPRDWTGPYEGGYYTPKMQMKLIKTRVKKYLDELDYEDIDEVYQAVNTIQSTAWSINGPMLDVIKELWDRSATIGKLPQRDQEPLPAKPEDMDTNEEARKEWRKQAAQVHQYNVRLIGKRASTAQRLWIAERFRSEEAIYFPHQLDWRGRIYPATPLLNPQSDDLAKGLLQFAEGKELGKEGAWWLGVHLANTFGHDKVSLQERRDWVAENEEMILESAMHPLDGTMRWADADKPYQFLAACFEWLGYTIEGPGYKSHQPIALDGSCSGLQHFSAMLRDPVGANATNLSPSEQPQDIYGQVAEVAHRYVQEDAESGDELAKAWLGKVTRKIAKRPTMTLPYGVTAYGMKDQILEVLKEAKQEGQPILDEEVNLFTAAGYIAKQINKGIREVVLAAPEAMTWLQKVAKIASEDEIPVTWRTPMGLPIHQKYAATKKRQIKCHFGSLVVKPSINEELDKLDRRRQAAGIAPNFVHSLDASHLMLTVHYAAQLGLDSFAMVHDSFGVHASDATDLSWILRKAFVDQYSTDQLESFREQVAAQLSDEQRAKLPPVPEKGDLDIKEVMQSWYFFA